MARSVAWMVALMMMTGLVTATEGCSLDALPKRVFVTRAAFNGNLGGLTGADAQCASFATAAGIDGTWKAWLSDSTMDARDRMADVGPWVDMKGHLVFRDKDQLMGYPTTAVDVDETNGSTPLFYWTGTMLGGTRTASTCGDWTGSGVDRAGTIGYSSTTQWTDGNEEQCGYTNHLLCLEQ